MCELRSDKVRVLVVAYGDEAFVPHFGIGELIDGTVFGQCRVQIRPYIMCNGIENNAFSRIPTVVNVQALPTSIFSVENRPHKSTKNVCFIWGEPRRELIPRRVLSFHFFSRFKVKEMEARSVSIVREDFRHRHSDTVLAPKVGQIIGEKVYEIPLEFVLLGIRHRIFIAVIALSLH